MAIEFNVILNMKDQCYQPKNPCLHQGDNLPINNSTVKNKQFLKLEI